MRTANKAGWSAGEAVLPRKPVASLPLKARGGSGEGLGFVVHVGLIEAP